MGSWKDANDYKTERDMLREDLRMAMLVVDTQAKRIGQLEDELKALRAPSWWTRGQETWNELGGRHATYEDEEGNVWRCYEDYVKYGPAQEEDA